MGRGEFMLQSKCPRGWGFELATIGANSSAALFGGLNLPRLCRLAPTTHPPFSRTEWHRESPNFFGEIPQKKKVKKIIKNNDTGAKFRVIENGPKTTTQGPKPCKTASEPLKTPRSNILNQF